MKKIKFYSLSFFGLLAFSSILAVSLSSCADATTSTTQTTPSQELIPPTLSPDTFSVISGETRLNTTDRPGTYYMNKKYGANGSETPFTFGSYQIYNISIPINWNNVPAGTTYYALKLVDLTYPWIHWMMANINAASLSPSNQLPENFGFNMATSIGTNGLAAGQTSWTSDGIVAQPGISDIYSTYINFGGFAPPNADHEYQITLYALSSQLSINNDFSQSNLISALSGKVLGEASFTFWYRYIGASYSNIYW